MLAVLFEHEMWMVAAMVPVAMLFYRRLRRRNPTQSRVWHLAKAILASFGLVLLVGIGIAVLWPNASLPQWLQVILFFCFVISCVAVVYGFIDDLRQARPNKLGPH